MALVEIVFLAALVQELPAEASVATPDARQMRAVVEKSLPYLEKEGRAWLDQRKCVSCHHGSFMMWSLREAQRRGFDTIEPARIDELTQRTLTMFLADREKYEKEKKGHVESTHLLLGYGSPREATAAAQESLTTLAALVRNDQQAPGNWKYAGQVQDRPAAEADESTTAWAVLALAGWNSQDDAARQSREQALSWLAKAPVGEANEARIVRLLLELQFGDSERAGKLADELIARQNADGGWSWSKKRGSDAYAAGEALYALGKAGRASDPAVGKAWQFLKSTQREDGSWLAPTKKASGSDAIAIYWGTAWAVIGLLETLPE